MTSKFKPNVSLWKPLGATALLAFALGACVQQTTVGSLDSAGAQSASTSDAPASPSESQALVGAPVRNADDLRQLSSTFASIAAKVTPAVVNIESLTVTPGRTAIVRDPFSEFFGGAGGGRMLREPDRTSQSLGSGVIVSNDGIIVTNNHVVENATKIRVTLSDKRRYTARLLGTDPDTDVAVLKIEGSKLPALKWSDTNRLKVGEIVMAVGSPFNLSSTVTQGILSAKGRRDLGISAYEDFLQTDAAINPGNSGGALVDVDGNLIGINTAILSRSGGSQGIGLAIPSNLARNISEQLSKTGRVTRGWLGMVVEPVTEDEAETLKLGEARGVQVTGVYGNSPVAQLPWGQQSTVIVQSVNGQAIDTPGQLRILASEATPGSEVKIRAWVDGAVRDFSVRAGRRGRNVQGV